MSSALAVLHVIFWIEIVEGKDRPPQLGPVLHVDPHGKLCALVLRAAECIKGLNRVIGMDSGFGVLSTLPELRKRGLHGTVVLKKNSGPRDFQATRSSKLCEWKK